MPSWPDVDKVFIPGDEIMVVLSADKMRRIGFTDSEFINAGALDLLLIGPASAKVSGSASSVLSPYWLCDRAGHMELRVVSAS